MLIIEFEDFCYEKDVPIGIEVKEHYHDLVLCLTNDNWKCNNCEKFHGKKISKYYCSLCDYSMCENCVIVLYSKNNFLKKSLPKEATPSNKSVNIQFYNSDYHNHRLVFCRSSRNFNYYSQWICNNCGEQYDNDQWSFYCTVCDFDLCCDCCGYH